MEFQLKDNMMEIKSHMESKIALINETMNRQIELVHKDLKASSAKTETLVECVAISNSHLENVHGLIVIVNDSIELAHSKILETENKLTEVNIKVDQNRDSITMTKKKQEEKFKELEGLINSIMNARIQESSYVSP